MTTGTDLRARGKDIVGLSVITNALAEVDPGGQKFHLDVVGAYSQQTKAALGQRLSAGAFTLHGRLGWEETLAVVHSATFSVVLRNQADRRSNLGFPSKVPESLILGTPILGNVFSDLSEHLENGVNAVLVANPTLEALVEALRSLPIEIDRESVRLNALDLYTPKAWSDTLSKFIAGDL
ncbi:glycosyltransferase [Pseudarthrobacter sp. H3Y2-7]|uniref:glycosyltransferase n=1 Tax=Pseudarthrobacter naphthalenicus TaxID=3031328 RepID=UPI0023B05BFF|nr:glycosyltransferase [Pseudarthrobacter sp. H3Y2-7]MDE8668150.1 glycosyltransferase [Pseudarthrobacter sp. H3Y2-7]